MSFHTYTNYVDSTINWLPRQPSQWLTKPIKAIATINDDTLPETADPELKIEYVDIGSVSLENGIEKTEAMSFGDSPSRARRLPREGDVLVSTVRTYLKAIAPVISQVSNLVCSTGFAVIRPKPELEPGFLKYALQEEHFIQEVISRSTGVSYPAINASDIGRIKICLPCRDEQLSIARFLDKETAKIDDLIAEQEVLIKLLQEKRQAVISHAVTKGLNPDAPMKDSGVEWLGEIPEHWQIKRVKHCIDPVRPVTYGILKPGEIDENGVPMIRAQDYSKEWNQKSEILMVSAEVEAPYIRSRVRTGDVLITAVGAGIGNCAVVPDYLDGANISRASCRISVNSQKISGSYLLHALKSITTKTTIELAMRGAAQPVLNNSEVENLLVPLPPLQEQSHLLQALDFQVQQLDKQQDLAFLQIELLKERRSALISAAVTGQIDVRGLLPQAEVL